MEKAKVKLVSDTGRTWTSQEGKMFKISKITLDDGREGETMSDKFKAGEEATFATMEKEYKGVKSLSFKYISENKGGTQRFTRDPDLEKMKQQMIIAQSCMGKAVELAVHGKIEYKQIEESTDKLMGIINKLAKKHNEQSI